MAQTALFAAADIGNKRAKLARAFGVWNPQAQSWVLKDCTNPQLQGILEVYSQPSHYAPLPESVLQDGVGVQSYDFTAFGDTQRYVFGDDVRHLITHTHELYGENRYETDVFAHAVSNAIHALSQDCRRGESYFPLALALFVPPEDKDAYEPLLKTIAVNDEFAHVAIVNGEQQRWPFLNLKGRPAVFVIPEGLAALLNFDLNHNGQPRAQTFDRQNGRTVIIDIGGNTIDVAMFEGNRVVTRTNRQMTFRHFGVKQWVQDPVTQYLRVQQRINAKDIAGRVEAMLASGNSALLYQGRSIECYDVIRDSVNKWYDMVKQVIVEAEYQNFADFDHLVVIGGGGAMLQASFEAEYPHLFRSLPQDVAPANANAQGAIAAMLAAVTL